MKSNSNFPQQCRKNLGYHQDEKGVTSSSNLNNFSSGRYDKSKIGEDKSY